MKISNPLKLASFFLILLSCSDPVDPAGKAIKEKNNSASFCSFNDDTKVNASGRTQSFTPGCVPKIDKCVITYYLANFCNDPDIYGHEIEKLEEAFKRWSDVTDLTFTYANHPATADILFEFTDGLPAGNDEFEAGFDCDTDSPRKIYFDDNQIWTDQPFDADDDKNALLALFGVAATHEIGHALGVGHSNDAKDLMYGGGNVFSQLREGDINAIQNLYGKKTTEDVIDHIQVVCVGDVTTVYFPNGDDWATPTLDTEGGVQVVAETDQSVDVKAVSAEPGRLYFSECNYITFITAPYAPSSIIGQSKICQGMEGKFEVTPVLGADEYIWSVDDPSACQLTSYLNTCYIESAIKPFVLSVKTKNKCGESPSVSKHIFIQYNLDLPCADSE